MAEDDAISQSQSETPMDMDQVPNGPGHSDESNAGLVPDTSVRDDSLEGACGLLMKLPNSVADDLRGIASWSGAEAWATLKTIILRPGERVMITRNELENNSLIAKSRTDTPMFDMSKAIGESNPVEWIKLPTDARGLVIKAAPPGHAYCTTAHLGPQNGPIVEGLIMSLLPDLAIFDIDSSFWAWIGASRLAGIPESEEAIQGLCKDFVAMIGRNQSSIIQSHERQEKFSAQFRPMHRDLSLPTKRGGAAHTYRGGAPPPIPPGQPQTMPYFSGPTRWRWPWDILSRASHLPPDNQLPANLTAVLDMELLSRIADSDEFTAARAKERIELFGRWSLKNYLSEPVKFDDEFTFGMTQPPPLTGQLQDKTWVTPEITGTPDRCWLASSVEVEIYDKLFAPLVEREDNDVFIVGRYGFMGSRLANGMQQETPDSWQSHLETHNQSPVAVSTPIAVSDDFHIQQFKKKRFWAFFAHNSIAATDISDLAKLHFYDANKTLITTYTRPERPIKGVSPSGKVSYGPPYILKWKDFTSTYPQAKDLYFRIENQEQLFNILGAVKKRVWYIVRSEKDFEKFQYKLDKFAERNSTTVFVEDLPEGEQATPLSAKPLAKKQRGSANHWFLCIYDKQTNELWDHNSFNTDQGIANSIKANIRDNILELISLFGMPAPTAPFRIRRADAYLQTNGFDCGIISMNNLLMFVMDRLSVGQGRPSQFSRGGTSPAGWRYTFRNFEQRGASAMRRFLEACYNAGSERAQILEGVLPQYLDPSCPTRGHHLEARDWHHDSQSVWFKFTKAQSTVFDEEQGQRFEELAWLEDYSPLGAKFQRAAVMMYPFIDRHSGHGRQLQLIRYHLENAGGVLFSCKRPPNPYDSKPCEGSCDHFMDIVPVPLNCKVILQP
ncbi:hypothetical protein FN846DRAFT_81646 [Sphaerosporella brunnea]|uniref:Uncharacterized protein n=1 Tax=Sphaerosporella brunnea TaxID=1250544 RepID=A0A5J5F9D1_9PEZI|nr:hypothetical protein FN846DRAFT_81646 [Sphaerosporella brunnea]